MELDLNPNWLSNLGPLPWTSVCSSKMEAVTCLHEGLGAVTKLQLEGMRTRTSQSTWVGSRPHLQGLDTRSSFLQVAHTATVYRCVEAPVKCYYTRKTQASAYSGSLSQTESYENHQGGKKRAVGSQAVRSSSWLWFTIHRYWMSSLTSESLSEPCQGGSPGQRSRLTPLDTGSLSSVCLQGRGGDREPVPKPCE